MRPMFTKSVAIIAWIAVVCPACSPSKVETRSDCDSVPFEIVQNMVGSAGQGTAMVSMRQEDVSTAKLTCVAARLSKTFPSWRDVDVQMFDSVDAAKNFKWNQIGHSAAPDAGLERVDYEKHLRATYTIDSAKDQTYLTIRALLRQPETYATRIDLPLKGAPRCRFDVANRCLLSAGSPAYPGTAAGAFEGKVTLQADIATDGTIKSVRVTHANGGSAEARDVLSRAAVENVKAWRLDPAPREDTVNINYQYEFVDGPRKISPEEVVRSVVFGLVEVEMKSGTDLVVRRFASVDSSQ
jgi:TonB family protein